MRGRGATETGPDHAAAGVLRSDAVDILYGDFTTSRQTDKRLTAACDLSDADIQRLMVGPYSEGLRSWGHCRCGVSDWWWATAEELPEEWKRYASALNELHHKSKQSRRFLNHLDGSLAAHDAAADDRIDLREAAITIPGWAPDHLLVIGSDSECDILMKSGAARKRAIELLSGDQGTWKWVVFADTRGRSKEGLLYLDADGSMLGYMPDIEDH